MRFGRHQILPSFWNLLARDPGGSKGSQWFPNQVHVATHIINIYIHTYIYIYIYMYNYIYIYSHSRGFPCYFFLNIRCLYLLRIPAPPVGAHDLLRSSWPNSSAAFPWSSGPFMKNSWPRRERSWSKILVEWWWIEKPFGGQITRGMQLFDFDWATIPVSGRRRE